MRCFFILALIAFSVSSHSLISKEEEEEGGCRTKFGRCIGQSYLTKAYSSCNVGGVEDGDNFVLLKKEDRKVVSGLKWQCVEYARRWLIDNREVTFADVKYAYYIWELKNGEQVHTRQQVPLLQFKNKISKMPPEIGDLLIYSADFAETGHVAVVVSVNSNSITIAEQNYFNDLWDGGNYSRRLLLEKDGESRYRIFDEALIGWIRFAL